MAEHFVAKVSDLADGQKTIFKTGKHEIGVFRDRDSYYAYSNYCLHQGGPACEGLIIAKVDEKLDENLISLGMRFNHDELHFVCPWHGWEYDLKTGECVADRRMRLRKYEVRVRDGEIFVIV
jgi:nitrite reductase/ring-hydroxylating ferredoxin subunit